MSKINLSYRSLLSGLTLAFSTGLSVAGVGGGGSNSSLPVVSSGGSGSETLTYMKEISGIGTATQTAVSSTYTLSLDNKTLTYRVASTLANPNSPSGYFWVGTQSDGSALPLAKVPAVHLCNSATSTTGYVLISSRATLVTDVSELIGKTLYRRNCNFSPSTAKSNFIKMNADGSMFITEDGGSTTWNAAYVTKFFNPSGYTNMLDTGNQEKGLAKIYKTTVGGSIRYFIANTGYVPNSSGEILFSWVDFWIDSGF